MSQVLHAMLRAMFDYAGLFPPAGLGMAEAAANYAAYRAGSRAWMLGRFVLPADRLAEFESVSRLLHQPHSQPWRLSVLLGDDHAAGFEAIRLFNSRGGAIDTVEGRATDVEAVTQLGDSNLPGLTLYIELPAGADRALVDAVGAVGARAKIRTGGITAAAFPAPDAVVDFITSCIASRVAWKATAGLHHAIRASYRLTYRPDAPSAPMYGFLNLAFAAALLCSGADSATARGALLETDAQRFSFGDDTASWEGNRLTEPQLEVMRSGCLTAIGSCSFHEPVAELQELGLLEGTNAEEV